MTFDGGTMTRNTLKGIGFIVLSIILLYGAMFAVCGGAMPLWFAASTGVVLLVGAVASFIAGFSLIVSEHQWP